SLDGTAALLVRRHDGLTWAALFNTRSAPHGAHLAQAIDPYLHLAADKVREWPEVDLFSDFL
ncbi:MAG: penicillin-binding protein, partial [Planctomycetota bacterium]|nr:penicillin-binding protein [Planctomycetota bacterium]